MAGYDLEEKQKPFKPAFNSDTMTLEAKFEKKNNEITEIRTGTKKVKGFPVKKGDILSAYLLAKKYLAEALKTDKKGKKKAVK